MKFLVGIKRGMTQVFAADGRVEPVTVVSVPTVTVSDLKTAERDGYAAVKVVAGEKRGRWKKGATVAARQRAIEREFRAGVGDTVSDAPAVGEALAITTFAPGDMVRATGVSKGRGFQGVVKRHGFHGGSRTHGQKHSEREPGSIGGGLRTRVPKGMRMAGRMGNDRVTVRNLQVVAVDAAKNELLIRGALPGRRGGWVEIRG